jgi:lysozyme
MQPSDACKALVRSSEGCVYTVYEDSGGVLTAGIGHTGPGLVFGAAVTPEQVEDWFEADLSKAAAAVTLLAGKCTQGQFDALTDFVFNLGANALAGSTLLKKHLAGDYAGAAAEFPRWDHCNGVVLPGLLTRRLAEKALYVGNA